ncbi:MAG: anti-sigma factor family protein [Acidobacteriaceae bacterium]
MTCTEFLAELTDYLDGKLDAELEAEIRTHLDACSHCLVIYNTTCKTIEIYRNHELYELPAALRTRLQEAILAKCRKGC